MKILLLFALLLATSTNAKPPPQRLISLAPHTTELIYLLDVGDKLVAASDYSDYPLAAKALPRVANHQGVDFEQIVRLAPDLIIAWQGGNKPQDLARLVTLGYPVYLSKPKRLEDIASELKALGKRLGVPEQGERLAANYAKQLQNLKKAYQQKKSKRVFYYIWPQPLMSIGKNTWANQLLTLCGGQNIFANSPVEYPQVSVEQVIKRKPQLIIAAMDTSADSVKQYWQSWQKALPFKTQQLNPDLLQRFTPRVLSGIEALCTTIQNE